MRKMKIFPTYDTNNGRKLSVRSLETKISVFIDNNGYLVDVKPYNGENGECNGLILIYDEYEKGH